MERLLPERDYGVDAGRFVFAFLVVTLHMPMLGGWYLLPVARCAVPFFYLVSGYYMFKPDSRGFGRSILRNWRKWLKLYVAYTAIFLLVSCVLKAAVPGNSYDWTRTDTLSMLLEGVCPFIDEVHHGADTYGIMTLWFLYAGTLAMLVLYAMRNSVGRLSSLLLVALVYVAAVSVNVVWGERVVPRLFTAAIPSLFLGAFIRCHYEAVQGVFLRHKQLFVSAGFLVAYGEFVINRGGYNEIYYSTVPFTCILFVAMLAYNPPALSVVSRVPVKCTLDIYVWHRLAYCLVCLAGVSLGPWASLVVFLLVFVVSFFIRKYVEPCKK